MAVHSLKLYLADSTLFDIELLFKDLNSRQQLRCSTITDLERRREYIVSRFLKNQFLDSAYFSLSHSKAWVGLLVSKTDRIGFDCELINPDRDISGALSRFLSPEEQRNISSQTSQNYCHWCLKEAYGKYKGFGLHQKLKHFEVNFENSSFKSPEDPLYVYHSRWSHLQLAVCIGRPVSIQTVLVNPSGQDSEESLIWSSLEKSSD